MNHVSPATLLLALASVAAHAQPLCSSDGQPHPTAILERFINADCQACWGDAHTPRPARGEVALDWIVPGSRGDDAPLSAAARQDASNRLAALQRAAPAAFDVRRQKSTNDAGPLRVARGLAINDYLGGLIEWARPSPGRWSAWLVLVETIPAGVEGTPVVRNLVRNVLQLDWTVDPKAGSQPLVESRPMQIPEGAQPARLRVVGWVEDARGRIRAIAQSARCTEN